MLVYDPAANPLNNNEWAFPLTECFHVAAMAFSIGTIAIVDLRLFGLGIRNQTAGQLVRDMEIWTLAGFAVVITSGLMIFSSDPLMYLRNFPFQFKMAVLLLGIVYNYTVHRKVAQSASAVAGVRYLVGGISLALWISIVFAGIFIAFV